MARKRLKILFAIAEAYPFAKVGGLADVGAALPKNLARRGHDVRLVLPGYASIGRGRRLGSLPIPLGDVIEGVDVHAHGRHEGVSVYTLGNGKHFERGRIYGYDDREVLPFVLFSKAVVALAARTRWLPDVVHAHDWHTGLVPQYLRQGPDRAALERAAAVLTIHNLGYQGSLDTRLEGALGLGDQFRGSLLARGIAFADAINTVSRRYRAEILTPQNGNGLHGLLNARRDVLCGIRNGVDYDEFDPAADRQLVARYDRSSLELRTANKLALQQLSGLSVAPDVPLIGIVARLVDQKGLALVCASIDGIVGLGAQLVVVGDGERRYVRALRRATVRHGGAVARPPATDEQTARLVYAGADLFLAPSLYEPCGLGPLIALRYGAVPVVRRTGGLADTIQDYVRHPEAGLGFTFVEKRPEELLRTLATALSVYRRREQWEELQRRCMAADYSWTAPTGEYEALYGEARARRGVGAVHAGAAR